MKSIARRITPGRQRQEALGQTEVLLALQGVPVDCQASGTGSGSGSSTAGSGSGSQ